MNNLPYEEQADTELFEKLMGDLMKPVYVHRNAMARIRKDLREGNPYPNRVKGNRTLAAKAQHECGAIMARYVLEVDARERKKHFGE